MGNYLIERSEFAYQVNESKRCFTKGKMTMLHARKDYNERIQDSDGIIPMEEPVFLLRAQDVLMLPVLEHYLMLLRARNKHDKPLEIAVVRHIARTMAWYLAHEPKEPDIPLSVVED